MLGQEVAEGRGMKLLMKAIPMISCREATTLHSRGMDERLSVPRWISLKSHVAMCPHCCNATRSLDLLRKAMRSVVDGDVPRGDWL